MQTGLITIDMQKCIEETPVHAIAHRGRSEDALTPAVKTDSRSVIGSLQWVCSMCRPDLSADTSLLQSGNILVQDLKEADKALQFLKDTSSVGIKIYPIPLSKLSFITFTDASWGNALGGRSQAGMLICACNIEVLEKPSHASILEWKSHRLERSTRSTIGSEAASFHAGVDHSYYLAMFMSEFVYANFRAMQAVKPVVPIFPCTDCKSLYDTLKKLSSSVDEKRLQIDLSSIRESINVDAFKWVPTHEMRADGLTKRSQKLREEFHAWLLDPVVRLQDTPSP